MARRNKSYQYYNYQSYGSNGKFLFVLNSGAVQARSLMSDPRNELHSIQCSPESWSSSDYEGLIMNATTFIYEGTTSKEIPSQVPNLVDYESALNDLIAFIFEGAK